MQARKFAGASTFWQVQQEGRVLFYPQVLGPRLMWRALRQGLAMRCTSGPVISSELTPLHDQQAHTTLRPVSSHHSTTSELTPLYDQRAHTTLQHSKIYERCGGGGASGPIYEKCGGGPFRFRSDTFGHTENIYMYLPTCYLGILHTRARMCRQRLTYYNFFVIHMLGGACALHAPPPSPLNPPLKITPSCNVST